MQTCLSKIIQIQFKWIMLPLLRGTGKLGMMPVQRDQILAFILGHRLRNLQTCHWWSLLGTGILRRSWCRWCKVESRRDSGQLRSLRGVDRLRRKDRGRNRRLGVHFRIDIWFHWRCILRSPREGGLGRFRLQRRIGWSGLKQRWVRVCCYLRSPIEILGRCFQGGRLHQGW